MDGPVTLSADSISSLVDAFVQKILDPVVAGQLVAVYGPLVASWFRPWLWFGVGLVVGVVGGYVFFARLWR